MSKDLPRRPSLGSLRKQAKALVRDYRNESADAQGLVIEYFPGQMFANERVVELLLEHGADINCLSVDGDTSFDCALAAGNQIAAAVLRLHGGVEGHRQSQPISPRKV